MDHLDPMTPSRPLAKTLRYWLPVVAWAALIGLFSSELGHAGWSYRWVRALLVFFSPEISSKTVYLVHIAVRRLAHVSEYFILTLLLYRALREDVLNGAHWRWVGWAATAALGVAGLDELHQATTVRRTGSLVDVGIDALGVLTALVLLAWLHFRPAVEYRQPS